MNKAIKYKVYPTTEQCILFAKTFGCCRKIYNLMLADKIVYYQEHQKTLQTTPAQYKKDYPYLKEVDSLALANVQMNLQMAYKNFFRDKKVGFPKYKSAKYSRKSYTTNNQKSTVAITNSYFWKFNSLIINNRIGTIRIYACGHCVRRANKETCRNAVVVEAGNSDFYKSG